jgi:transposase-like protein
MAKKKSERRSFTEAQKRKHLQAVDKIKARGGSVTEYYEKHKLHSSAIFNWRKQLNGGVSPKRNTNGKKRRRRTTQPTTDIAGQVQALVTENAALRAALSDVRTEVQRAIGA